MKKITFSLFFLIFVVVFMGCSKSPKNTTGETATNPSNLPPTADAGEDQSVLEQTPINLNVKAVDLDGRIKAYRWQQVSGTKATQVVGLNKPSVTFIAPTLTKQQSLVFKITVQDNDEADAEDFVTITVNPVNRAPQIVTEGQVDADEQTAVSLNSEIIDLDGTIESILWQQIAGKSILLDNPLDAKLSFKTPTVTEIETLVFSLTVTDNEGSAVSTSVNVNVLPVNKKPSITILQTDDNGLFEDSLITINSQSVDEDGEVTGHSWRQLKGLPVSLGRDDGASLQFFAPAVEQAETLSFELTINDNEGATHSKNVDIIVSPLPVISISGMVNHGPISPQSSVSMTRVRFDGTDSKKLSVLSEAESFGEFSMKLPGIGLYRAEVSSRFLNILTGSVVLSPIVFKAMLHIEDVKVSQNINILTHLTYLRVAELVSQGKKPGEAIEQSETELIQALNNVIKGESIAPFSALGFFDTPYSKPSGYLLAISTMIFNYASTRSVDGNVSLEMSRVLDELIKDFSSDGLFDKSEKILEAIKQSHASIDYQTISQQLDDFAKSHGYTDKLANLHAYLDNDLDGVSNAIDKDDDNDDVLDEKDITPFGFKLLQPKCSRGLRNNPFEMESGVYHIQSFYKADQYIHDRGGLKSSPIISKMLRNSRWIIDKTEHENSFSIRQKNSDNYLYLDVSDNNQLKLGKPTGLPTDVAYWEFDEVDKGRPLLLIFRIRNVNNIDYFLTVEDQIPSIWKPGYRSDVINARAVGEDGGWAYFWIFCTAELDIDDALADNSPLIETYDLPKCSDGSYDRPVERPSDVYHIQNVFRPDQYLNRQGHFKSSQIFSSSKLNTRWRIERVDDNYYSIISEVDDLHMYIDDGRLSLGPREIISEKLRSWRLEVVDPVNGPAEFVYRVRNAQFPEFYLANESQFEPAAYHGLDSHLVELRDDHMPHWHSALWMFCEAK